MLGLAVVLAVSCTAGSPVAEAPSTTVPSPPAPISTVLPQPADPTTTVAAPDPVVALVVGDFGIGTPAEYEVAAAMRAAAHTLAPAAIITTGDNFYLDDVAAIWSDPFDWVIDSSIPVWPSWGNHDIETARRRKLVRDTLGISERWYARRLGEAVVIVLDANRPASAEQLRWLRASLAAHEAQPVVVAFHQPALSCSLHGSSPLVLDTWVPLFERYGVELVLNGHDHNYQRFQQRGVTYVVSGGGGATLYEVAACPAGTDPPLVADELRHHFLVLTVSGDAIEVVALSSEGEEIDRVEVTAWQAPPPPVPEGG